MLSFFFFNDTATTEIYTLSLHDALPISCVHDRRMGVALEVGRDQLLLGEVEDALHGTLDRKSTRLNSSHVRISYAVFCLKKKKNRAALACSSVRKTSLDASCCVRFFRHT